MIPRLVPFANTPTNCTHMRFSCTGCHNAIDTWLQEFEDTNLSHALDLIMKTANNTDPH